MRSGAEHFAVSIAILTDELAVGVEGPEQREPHRDLVDRAVVVDWRVAQLEYPTGVQLLEPALGNNAVVVDHDPFEVVLAHVAPFDVEVLVVGPHGR